jgi:predicted SprT family Zn-dependent metalloprotease
MFEIIDDNHPAAKEVLRQDEIRKLAVSLMIDHGLIEQGWTFDFINAIKRVGQCNWTDKVISYSTHYLDSDFASIRNTILHEIAHALVPPHKYRNRWIYHGYEWRSKAREIGCTGDTCANADEGLAAKPVTYNYKIECPRCKRSWLRVRKPKAAMFKGRCPRCKVTVKIYQFIR